MITILYNLSQKYENKRNTSYSFYEASIIIIPKPEKEITIKENYKSISQAKILNKILANKFNNVSKKLYTMSKWDLFQVCKAGLTFEKSIDVMHHINRLKKKNHVIISIHAEKAFDKIQHPYMIFKNSANQESRTSFVW